MTYRKPRELRPLTIVDSNYATDKTDRRSVSGNLDTLGGIVVGWLCKTQGSATLSSTEAEYVSAATGAQSIVFWLCFYKNVDLKSFCQVYLSRTILGQFF